MFILKEHFSEVIFKKLSYHIFFLDFFLQNRSVWEGVGTPPPHTK